MGIYVYMVSDRSSLFRGADSCIMRDCHLGPSTPDCSDAAEIENCRRRHW